MKVLISLVKTYSNLCVTLDSAIHRMEDRNIIDDIVENDHNDQAIQLA